MYITRQSIEARLPKPLLVQALDDEGTGEETVGVLDTIIANACLEVDGYLAGLYPVPFSGTPPAAVVQAALAFALEAIYTRRDVALPKVLETQAAWHRDHLQKVGNRELPLDSSLERNFTPGAAITESTSINAQML